jgi:3-methyl-2-oxobutanoate hydroxymethyltransferase
MSTPPQDRKKVTTLTFRQKKENKQPITMLTAYDYGSALLVEKAGIDSILVGDSLGMVMLGFETTLPVTMDQMIHHCQAVSRGAKMAMLIGDMPFLSYQVSTSEAVRNAGRFIQEAGMDGVKLEGGRERTEVIKAIVQTGIPVMGHLGLTPQSINQFGGFRTQGKTADAAFHLVEDALLLEDAGCFGIVLESIPEKLAALISERINIPTIGIGAGVGCDGQVLVYHDLLGMFDRFRPRFAKAYVNLGPIILKALTEYKEEVETRSFPGPEHSFEITEENWNTLLERLKK